MVKIIQIQIKSFMFFKQVKFFSGSIPEKRISNS